MAKPVEVDPYERSTPKADPNFQNFVSNWKRLRSGLTVFLGAGASVGAKNKQGNFLPTAFELRNEIWQLLMIDDHQRATFDPANLKSMTLEHAAAIAEARTGRRAVLDQVTSTFDCAKPLWQHAALPFLRPKAVFTVNFDELVEKGWRLQAGQHSVNELHLRYRSKADTNVPHTPLFKPHGTLQHARMPVGSGGLVVSMFDYFEMIGDYRSMIEEFLSDFDQSCVLFIGYSFGDMDICAELYRLRRKRDVPWYAVFPRDDADVKRMYQDKFGVLQINKRFLDFLVDLDAEVDFIPQQWKFQNLSTLRSGATIQ
jgi:hypothetical protein